MSIQWSETVMPTGDRATQNSHFKRTLEAWAYFYPKAQEPQVTLGLKPGPGRKGRAQCYT